MGVSVVVAKSFARAFFRNAMNNGLALITAPVDGPVAGQSVTVDLLAGRVTQADRVVAQGAGLSPVLMQIISAGGLLAAIAAEQGLAGLGRGLSHAAPPR